MSKVVKDGNDFAIEVPIVAGISKGVPGAPPVKDGQIVVSTGDNETNKTNGAPAFYAGKGGNFQLVNKVFPIDKAGITIPAEDNGTASVGGFKVSGKNLDGEGVAEVKNFTANGVKVILSEGNYGSEFPSDAVEGQLFFLIP